MIPRNIDRILWTMLKKRSTMAPSKSQYLDYQLGQPRSIFSLFCVYVCHTCVAFSYYDFVIRCSFFIFFTGKKLTKCHFFFKVRSWYGQIKANIDIILSPSILSQLGKLSQTKFQVLGAIQGAYCTPKVGCFFQNVQNTAFLLLY